MDEAERQGRRDEFKTRSLEAALAIPLAVGAMVVLTFVMWLCANWSR